MSIVSSQREIGFGTFVAQGAIANVILTYLLAIGIVIWQPNPYNLLLVVILPVWLLVVASIGILIASCIWLAKLKLKRRPLMIVRAVIGTVVAALCYLIFRLLTEFIIDLDLLKGAAAYGLFLGLPAGLLAGSRFNPLRSVVLGRATTVRYPGSTRHATIPLRIGSILGLSESILYLVCVVPYGYRSTTILDFELLAPILVVLYFLVSFVVTLTWPPTYLLLVITVLVNAPFAIWTISPSSPHPGDSEFLAWLFGVYVVLWTIFLMGRMISTDSNLLVPEASQSAVSEGASNQPLIGSAK